MSCEEMTSMLNTMHRLYEKAVEQGKPYRIHRIKQLYNHFKTHAAEIFDMVPLDSVESYEQLLGPLPTLRKIVNLKNNAIKNLDYEGAATYRSQELNQIQKILLDKGLNAGEYFFCSNGIIFIR